ncbi:hypothetical protein GMRT_14429 [Giardia muris]|uniref:Uncharacterized protein n=1 Tax=Giardia muris TaxID=5742 RepID=A0A4Z1T561_GIAMU|nr:hypothetical protein GMRT_14429 [Giardia muris]|eukprot:TNJ27591.1 hypothetical protein GMRT_14429 [Giardia muris]
MQRFAAAAALAGARLDGREPHGLCETVLERRRGDVLMVRRGEALVLGLLRAVEEGKNEKEGEEEEEAELPIRCQIAGTARVDPGRKRALLSAMSILNSHVKVPKGRELLVTVIADAPTTLSAISVIVHKILESSSSDFLLLSAHLLSSKDDQRTGVWIMDATVAEVTHATGEVLVGLNHEGEALDIRLDGMARVHQETLTEGVRACLEGGLALWAQLGTL